MTRPKVPKVIPAFPPCLAFLPTTPVSFRSIDYFNFLFECIDCVDCVDWISKRLYSDSFRKRFESFIHPNFVRVVAGVDRQSLLVCLIESQTGVSVLEKERPPPQSKCLALVTPPWSTK